jgi:cysteinyl-tRNA synthetase
MITLYNSLSRKREEFVPADGKTVKLYTCGVTVYDYAHIGNFRTYITWDVLKRILKYQGYEVNHVMNITDVGHLTSDADSGEDRMEVAKKRERKTAWDVAKFYTDIYHRDFQELNILPPTHEVAATDTITDQIALALKLDSAGYLYKTADGMYFDTAKFPQYGALARLDKVELQAGARVDMGEKKSPMDFAVWKFSAKGEQ